MEAEDTLGAATARETELDQDVALVKGKICAADALERGGSHELRRALGEAMHDLGDHVVVERLPGDPRIERVPKLRVMLTPENARYYPGGRTAERAAPSTLPTTGSIVSVTTLPAANAAPGARPQHPRSPSDRAAAFCIIRLQSSASSAA